MTQRCKTAGTGAGRLYLFCLSVSLASAAIPAVHAAAATAAAAGGCVAKASTTTGRPGPLRVMLAVWWELRLMLHWPREWWMWPLPLLRGLLLSICTCAVVGARPRLVRWLGCVHTAAHPQRHRLTSSLQPYGDLSLHVCDTAIKNDTTDKIYDVTCTALSRTRGCPPPPPFFALPHHRSVPHQDGAGDTHRLRPSWEPGGECRTQTNAKVTSVVFWASRRAQIASRCLGSDLIK